MKINYLTLKKIWGFGFVLPALIYFIIFYFYPMLNAFYTSLTEYNLLSPRNFVGLSQYTRLLQDDFFIQSLIATFIFVFGSVTMLFVVSLLLSLLLNRISLFANFFSMVLYSPQVISAVVAAIIFRLLLHPRGIVNVSLGEVRYWLYNPSLAPLAVIMAAVWRYVGYYVILWLSGLKNIPKNLYEAARIDGASSLQSFRYITFPLLKPTMAFILIISTISFFRSFSLQYVLTGGGPGYSTNVIALAIYRRGLNDLRMGTASAMSIIMFIIIIIISIIQLRVTKSEEVTYE